MATGDTFTDLGTQFHITTTSSSPATEDEAGYDALTYAEVKGVVNIPPFGDEVADISEPTLSDSRVEHFPGVKDGGSLTIPFKFIEADAGQVVIIANQGSNDTFSFRVTDADGTEHFFFGRIGSVRRRDISTTSNKGYTMTIMINSAITDVAAA